MLFLGLSRISISLAYLRREREALLERLTRAQKRRAPQAEIDEIQRQTTILDLQIIRSNRADGCAARRT